jgi:thiol-disulfide isomerase/thioredoxin
MALSPLAASAYGTSTDTARWLAWPASRRLPALSLPTLEGAIWDLSQARGQTVLLNFWATWCEPCRAEMPSLQALHARLRERNVQVVAVNFKESRDAVQRYFSALGLEFGCLRDSYGEVTLAWGVRTFPTSVLVDRTGHPRWTIQGGVDWAEASVIQRMEPYL